jgi:hypothetical protein
MLFALMFVFYSDYDRLPVSGAKMVHLAIKAIIPKHAREIDRVPERCHAGYAEIR